MRSGYRTLAQLQATMATFAVHIIARRCAIFRDTTARRQDLLTALWLLLLRPLPAHQSGERPWCQTLWGLPLHKHSAASCQLLHP